METSEDAALVDARLTWSVAWPALRTDVDLLYHTTDTEMEDGGNVSLAKSSFFSRSCI